MDLANGQLVAESQIDGVQSPSFLAIHPNNQFLYSVNEIGNYEGEETGSISAFSIERQSGQLDFLNRQPSHGTAPCHLSIDATGKYVLVANYGSGTVAAFPIDTNGYLKTASSVIQHEGSSINEQRQTSPHAHAIMVAPNNHQAFSPALGLDQVIINQLNNETGQLKELNQTFSIEADQIFCAIGQKFSNLLDVFQSKKGKIMIDSDCKTSVENVWAGGDCVDQGEDLTVTAVAQGRDAAEAIHKSIISK
mgnify:CR=1 FL=1